MADNIETEESAPKWASWNKDVDVTTEKLSHMDINTDKSPAEDKKDTSLADPKETKTRSATSRGRSYQESRRHDRDRRDGRKRQEQKGDGKTESTELRSTDQKSQLESYDKSRELKENSKCKGQIPASGGVSQLKAGTGDCKPAKEERGKKYDGNVRGRRRVGDHSQGTSSSEVPGDRTPVNGSGKNSDSGADLLDLLNKSKEGKTSDHRQKSKSGKEIKLKSKTASELEAQWQREEAEKQKKEEEEKRRLEEERIKEEKEREEEERRKREEEEEAQRQRDEEIKSIKDFIHEMTERIQFRTSLRENNLHAAEDWPDESYFCKLDSSLKKNTAFVKKLKNITESQKDSLIKDFNGLNLTKYIGEVAAAITEAKLKMSDVNCVLHLCSLLHQRYADFSPVLMESWNKVLLNKKDEKVPNPSKLRVDLRFFADLIAVGVFTPKEGLPMLATQLTLLVSNDKEDHDNLTIILSFCKHCGDDYAGLLPRKYRLLAEKYNMEIPRSQVLPAERQKACQHLLKDYFTSLCKHLEKDHAELKNMEKQNRKILQTKGELSAERKEKYETALQTFQKLQANAITFADLLDEKLPELPDEDYKQDSDVVGCDIYHPMKDEFEYLGDTSLFDDEDTRQFYENIPDLKAVIPGILYKDSEKAPQMEQDIPLEDEQLDIEELEKALNLEMDANLGTDGKIQGQAVSNKEKVASSDNKDSTKAIPDVDPEDITPDIILEGEDEEVDIASSMKLVLEAFLNSLPNCVNRDLIDRAATDFCMNLNTKSNRKKLVRALFAVQRTRYDLLPFYARLVATLHPCMPEVASDLVTLLKGDLRWHIRKKDQINIESKLKTVRFIGELVKFKMFPKSEALHCLKMLMFDFSHHNIEMACSLLETCGRYLYRSPDSHHRTKVYLDVMMRKKAALHFDQRYTTMIENAYYYSNPPEVKQEAEKQRPPMHEYIRKLLYKDLNKITTEKVLRQLRKLNWDDKEIKSYATKCLSSVWNIRYNAIHCCANLLAGLASYHEDVAIHVVDAILEDIRLGMEVNHPKYNQRRVSCAKFLGELYNYRLVDTGVIFKTLYSFITFGVSLDESVESPLDPPEHLFRIRLTSVLLDTCGQYFDGGSSKKKLDYFLSYFQRYYWYKRKLPVWTPECPFPMEVDYVVRDTIETLRPKLKMFTSYEEAVTATEEMGKELRAKIADMLPKPKTESEQWAESETDPGLSTIQETEETDENSQGLSQVQVTDGTQESDGDRDDVTGSQSERPTRQHHDDEGEEGEGHVLAEGSDSDLLMESAGEEEADDQVTVLTGGPKRIQCPEDEDFMASFDKMMAETLQARSQEAMKMPQVEITVPMNIKTQKKPKPPVVNFLGMSASEKEEEEGEVDESGKMCFTLMTKKGNKVQFSTLNIPMSENFASKMREREEAERAEKERMKRVVLNIHERQEEEDYQEMLASLNRPAMANLNRERKVRYQHPKGAPDADKIFGSKKR